MFMIKNPKGQSSAKIVAGVTVLFLCTSSDDALYCYQVTSNIVDSKVTERTRFLYDFQLKILKGHNFTKTVGRVMLLFSVT